MSSTSNSDLAINARGGAALIVVDVQYDFLPPTGSLAVPDGLAVVPVIGELLDSGRYKWDAVVASQDWHPEGHISFASSHAGMGVFQDVQLRDARGHEYTQRLWPDHCVRTTRGAEIAAELLPKLAAYGDKYMLSRKGWHKEMEAYSAFEGYLTPGTAPADCPTELAPADRESELAAYLRKHNISKVVVTGVATDYCVAATAFSALDAKLDVLLVLPAVRGISEADSGKVVEKITARGGAVVGRDGSRWEEELAAWLAK